VPFLRAAPSWQLPERDATPEGVYLNRRRLLQGVAGAGLGAALAPLAGCGRSGSDAELRSTLQQPPLSAQKAPPAFQNLDRPTTDEILAGQYNNFYEFGGGKSIWPQAQKLPTQGWQVSVGGEVKTPRTYDLDDLKRRFRLEERIYRFRCVEAWSMVLPWIGFPMRALLADVEPTARARYVRFTSLYDSDRMPGPTFQLGSRPWPYTEALRLDEMANELAFFAIGIYGHALPKQHGAPLRAVLPWKYGFKGAKSIVGIEFTSTQPATFWHTVAPDEYGFQANVNPNVPHPRWSQATEKFIAHGPELSWEMRDTQLYNGYADWVAELYR